MSSAPYLTVKDAADVLGITDDGVRKLIRRNKLRAIKRSERTILIPRPAFDAYRRKLSGDVAEPADRSHESDAIAGTLAERCTEFERETGMTPDAWVAAWKAGDDDTAHTMQLAAVAVGLLAERQVIEHRRSSRAAVSA